MDVSGSSLAFEARNLAGSISRYFHHAAATYGDLLDAQATLEPLCARLAAANPGRVAVMRRFVDRAAPAPPHEADEADEADEALAFHSALYDLTDNPVLSLLGEAVSHLVVDQVLGGRDGIRVPLDEVWADHAAIATAVTAGDGGRAETLMAAHLRAQHDQWRRVIPERLAGSIDWP